jgi:hypothetical protein
MPIKINDYRMILGISGTVTSWLRRLRRDEAITTLSITELLAFGRNPAAMMRRVARRMVTLRTWPGMSATSAQTAPAAALAPARCARAGLLMQSEPARISAGGKTNDSRSGFQGNWPVDGVLAVPSNGVYDTRRVGLAASCGGSAAGGRTAGSGGSTFRERAGKARAGTLSRHQAAGS